MQVDGPRPEAPRWRAADWDSRLFGVAIGHIDVDDRSIGSLVDAEDDARRTGIACLFAEIRPDPVTLSCRLQDHGYQLVEVAVDLVHPTSTLADPAPPDVSVRRGTDADLPAVAQHLELLAPWSRFAADPRFGPDAAVRLHGAWVARAARGDDGRSLLVAESSDGIVGLATTHHRDRAPGVDLIATNRPGAGAGRALVGAAFERFGPRPSAGGPIAARNTASLRFSLGLGYQVSGTRYRFHRWLDPEGRR